VGDGLKGPCCPSPRLDGGRLALPLLVTALLLQGLWDWSLLKIKKINFFNFFRWSALQPPVEYTYANL
jgi:hypothetical protein